MEDLWRAVLPRIWSADSLSGALGHSYSFDAARRQVGVCEATVKRLERLPA